MGREIRFKDMKNKEFKLQVEDSDTISQIKTKIESQEKHPVDQQTIIFSGKVKSDDEVISSLNIKETDFFVIMIRKPKATPASTTSTTTTTPSTTTTTSTTTTAPASTTTPTTSAPTTSTATPTPTPAPTNPATPSSPAPTSVSVDSTLVQTLLDMGFLKEQAEVALKASRNDINGAIQLLSEYPEGIPERLLNTSAQPPVVPLPTSPSSPTTTTAPTSTTNIPTTSVPTSGGTGSVFDPLRQVPQFSHLRYLVQQNPELLQPILGQLAQENPQLLQLINQNQQEFLDLLKEPVDPSHLQSLSQGLGAQQIRVTPEEKEAIDRLEQLVQGMGIDRSRVIEAYFFCDKDEQLAANYLLEGNFDD